MMTLTITDRMIRSLDTRHTASCRPGGAEWQVTWLPGRILARDQPVAAMELAEASWQMPADCGPGLYDDQWWSRVDALAAVPGVPGRAAVSLASGVPEDDQADDN
jgi:hypothetical protein